MGAIRRDFQGGQLGHLTVSESRTHGDDSKSKKSSKKLTTTMGFYRLILFLAICLGFKFVAARKLSLELIVLRLWGIPAFYFIIIINLCTLLLVGFRFSTLCV